MKIALLAVPVVLLGFIAFRVVDGATIVVETCDDLVSAVEATAVEDTTANCVGEHFVFLSCGIENDEGEEEARTLTIKHHTLTIEAPDLRLAFGEIQFDNVRFELVSSGELVVTRTASFTVDTDIAVAESGGWLYVEEGSKARFLEKLEVRSYVIQSILDSGEFASETLFGGCLFNQGYVRVEGHATFSKCGNSGIGESPPGDGGAIFNGESGSILFAGGVFIEETSITDSEGACGAGIYNLGKVNIKGNSVFSELFADTEKGGGAIYNAEGAKFTFRNKASAAFSFNRAGSGSAVYNEGEFTFSGPALFYLNWNAVIENRAPGSMKLSSESSFWLGDTDDDLGAVSSFLGATLGFPDDLQFVSLEGPTTDCDHIYLETEEGLECHS